jgi:ABC-2 type transport system permease protein
MTAPSARAVCLGASAGTRASGLSGYRALARIALRQRSGERLLWLSRIALLGLVLLIFTRLWQALLPSASAAELVWYLAITEWITIAQPRLFLEIERDVRSGELAYRLGRPTSYLLGKLAEAFAEQALGLLVLGLSAALFAWALAPSLPREPGGLLWAIPLALLASVLGTLCSAVIGVSAFWLVDCSPLAWMFHKLTFVCGGLLVPLTLYPDWLRSLSLATPFAALLFGPAQMAFAGGADHALSVALQLGIWIGLVSGLLALLYARGVRALELHGG